ncbi:DNA-binding transcriptional regulator, AcrR family [Paenimyroides ummariense]|uniref:DNA-binding transcriptional regulator, AcrR family n=1 Tax=Paenimyroides ummariense TaxID=913024 RepID=A0A1I5GPZ8_9FLAO|nr:TetR/AcrR family transcriptional regulator [Paenimyroides ummariense]SFO38144.1 DNA-binding transcriptional regulator, AcrR family [Paenimyroides ummariense]
MSKANQTRQFIIEKTAPIFNKKGFAATSLSDITEATGLTKGSIYGNFENKDEVAIAVFKYNADRLWKKKENWITVYSDARSQLMALVDFYRKNWKELFESGGCPVMNAATESDDIMPAMKERVKNTVDSWVRNVANILEKGIKENVFRSNINTVEYARLFIMTIEGGVLLSKISDKPDSLYLALDRVNKIIDDEIII